MTDVLDKRVTDLETLVWEIPNLLNTHFARFEAALADNTSRIASLERTMITLQTDMRDLRGGVTRQLIEQDKQLAGIVQRLVAVDQRLDAVTLRLAAIEQRFDSSEMGTTAINSKLDAVLARLTAT
ncbi:MAG: hypothetical protein ACT4N2_04675 [Hyphomicrobium sp.]